jgi:hypothetical protein
MIGFIDILYIQLVTTINYSAIANLQTLQFAVAHTHTLGFSGSLVVSWKRIYHSHTVTANHIWSLLFTA